MGCSPSRMIRRKGLSYKGDKGCGLQHQGCSHTTLVMSCGSGKNRDGGRVLGLSPKEVEAVWEALSVSQLEGSVPFKENNLDCLYLQNPSGISVHNLEEREPINTMQNHNIVVLDKILPYMETQVLAEKERRLRFANLDFRRGVELGWSSDDEEGFDFAVDSNRHSRNMPRLQKLDKHATLFCEERGDPIKGPILDTSSSQPSSSFLSAVSMMQDPLPGDSPSMRPTPDPPNSEHLCCVFSYEARDFHNEVQDFDNEARDFEELSAQPISQNSQVSCPQGCSPSPPHALFKVEEMDALIPGLPNDLAQLCLMRVPFLKYESRYKLVSRRWRAVLMSPEFYTARKAFGIHETYICFVVHGSRLQLFNLQTHSWFCLPPLPKGQALYSPGFHVDPYDWWQIDTVAVCDGTLFVLGGDQADIFSLTPCSKPSDQVHKYDYCKKKWEKVMSMGMSRSHSAAISSGRNIYVAGGSAEIYEGASAEVYDFENDAWSPISRMNTAMRICVGLEHQGKLYVKGENAGPGCPIEGEVYDPAKKTWERMMPGLKAGLARGPAASASSCVFVADWKDSLLKRYIFELDFWEVVGNLPARFSRLVGHAETLYGFTGKIKVDPYSHRLISDSPTEVWRIDMSHKSLRFNMAADCSSKEISAMETHTSPLEARELHCSSEWICIWREHKQTTKIGGFTWVPCSAHYALLQD